MKISFCTTCMGRAHHLVETLPANIKANEDYPDLEFVVLDYNSKDGLEDLVKSRFSQEIESGRLVYYTEKTAQYFERCNAKNIAHLMASGDVVVNIDADNFTGPGYASELARIFADNQDVVVTCARKSTDMVGKIGMLSSNFRALRGYDEVLRGYGMEDVDLVQRAMARGIVRVALTRAGESAILHTKEERSRNLDGKPCPVKSNELNKKITLARGSLAQVNTAGWGRGVVYRNFSGVPITVGMEAVTS